MYQKWFVTFGMAICLIMLGLIWSKPTTVVEEKLVVEERAEIVSLDPKISKSEIIDLSTRLVDNFCSEYPNMEFSMGQRGHMHTEMMNNMINILKHKGYEIIEDGGGN